MPAPADLASAVLRLADEAPSPLLIVDETLAVVYANRPALQLLDARPDLPTWRTPGGELLGDLCAYAFGSGAELADRTVEIGNAVHGVAFLPLPAVGGISLLGLVVRPPETVGLDRLASLQHMTAALGGARSVDDVSALVVDQLADVLSAQSAALLVLDAPLGGLRIIADRGYGDGLRERWPVLPLDDTNPAGECAVTGEPVFLTSIAERDARYPSVAGRPTEVVASAVVPLLVAGDVVGVLSLGWQAPRQFAGADLDYLTAVAGQCAQALDRARLFDAEREARRVAESNQDRLRFLAEASALLMSSLDYEDTMRAVVRLIVPWLADMVALHVADDRGLRFVAVAHASAAQEAVMQRLRDAHDPYSHTPVVRDVFTTGKPRFAPVSGAAEADGAQPTAGAEGQHVSMFTTLRGVSAMTVPLRGRSGVVGVLSLGSTEDHSRREYGQDDLDVAVELGRRLGAAIENAQAHAALAAVAVALQRSLLPHDLPQVPSLRMAHRYVAGAADTVVGGDWYDVIPLSADRVGIVIGDVMGRGVRAAAVMGQLRVGVRAYAALDPPPETLLTHLDALVHDIDDTALVTCVYGIYEPGTGRFTFANAGHLPPMISGPDGVTSLSEAPSVPLGVGGFPFLGESVELPAGSTLLLFTDGLVESAAQSFDDGMRKVADVLSGHAEGDVEQLADDVFATMRPALGFDDDAALLAIHLLPMPDDSAAAIVLPALPSAAADARRFVLDTLARWEFVGSLDVAALLTSEVVTNAIRHASGGDVRVQLRRGGGFAYVEVADGDPRLPRLHRSTLDEEGGRGLFLIDALAARWGARLEARGKVVWFSIPA